MKKRYCIIMSCIMTFIFSSYAYAGMWDNMSKYARDPDAENRAWLIVGPILKILIMVFNVLGIIGTVLCFLFLLVVGIGSIFGKMEVSKKVLKTVGIVLLISMVCGGGMWADVGKMVQNNVITPTMDALQKNSEEVLKEQGINTEGTQQAPDGKPSPAPKQPPAVTKAPDAQPPAQ